MNLECHINVNLKSCPCTYEPCSHKGRCCECIAMHRRAGELPACLFPANIERTYDRSAERHARWVRDGK